MESLKKLSAAKGVAKESRKSMQSAMGMMMLEWQEVEGYFKVVHDIYHECLGELESKEKNLRVVEESVEKSLSEGFDSRRRLIDAGFKRLDEKGLSLKVALQEMEMEKMQRGKMRDSVDNQLKDLLKKERDLQCLFDEMKRVQSQMENMETELDLKEKTLRCRYDEIDATVKNLGIKLSEIDSKERMLMAKEKELQNREKEVASIQKVSEKMAGRKRVRNADEEEINVEESSSNKRPKAPHLQKSGTDNKSQAQMPGDSGSKYN